MSVDQLKNPGVSCKNQANTQVVSLGVRSTDAVRGNKLRMEHLFSSAGEQEEWNHCRENFSMTQLHARNEREAREQRCRQTSNSNRKRGVQSTQKAWAYRGLVYLSPHGQKFLGTRMYSVRQPQFKTIL